MKGKLEYTFKHAPEINIGSIFSRVDKNNKKHQCKVVWRSEYYIAYDYFNPYSNEVITASKYNERIYFKRQFGWDKEKGNWFLPSKYGNFYLEREVYNNDNTKTND
jgi:hypothetical protein